MNVNSGYYPELVALYRYLRIPFSPSRFSLSFARSPPSNTRSAGPVPELVYNGMHQGFGMTQPGKTSKVGAIWTVFVTVWSYLVLHVLAWYHVTLGHTRSQAHSLANMTFGDWCAKTWIARSFLENLLIPMFCSIMTTDATVVRDMPAAEILDYIAHAFSKDHSTVSGGVSQVVEALLQPILPNSVHVNVSINDVCAEGDSNERVCLHVADHGTGRAFSKTYHHVVFSMQTSQSVRLLQRYLDHLKTRFDASAAVQHVDNVINHLKQLRYDKSEVICHTDTSILPPNPLNWRDLNFVSAHPCDVSRTMATHIIWRQPGMAIMQTTNPLPWLMPNSSQRISESTFERFVLTLRGRDARRAFFDINARPCLGRLQGCIAPQAANIWVNGSWSYGVPLLEGLCYCFPDLTQDVLPAPGSWLPKFLPKNTSLPVT